MKKFLILVTLILIVTGCSYINSKSSTKQLSQTEQLCSELKRNITFNTASVTNVGAASITQQAQMIRLYEKNNCDNLKKNNSPSK